MSGQIDYSLDPARLDIHAVHALLSSAYWSQGIPFGTVAKAVAQSCCAGAYDAQGRLVGFARLVTDKATFAYLCDVIVDPAMRGRGTGKALVALLLGQDFVPGLRRIMLATSDAHELYEPFGFTSLATPASFMEVVRPMIYGARPPHDAISPELNE
ncbi:MAG: GNAT family N-acetyltransferase [Sphingopyxis solisilvae]|uniref:GNAT family N-acetyltransferase n=1 Tax=Sphingopyxis solisilvae TaxID=1886788 RepID=UPI004036516A